MGLDFVRFKRNLLTVHMFYCLLCNNNLTCYHNELLLTTGPKCNRHSHLKSNCLKVMYTYIFVVKSIFLSWNQIPGFIFRVSECRHNAFIPNNMFQGRGGERHKTKYIHSRAARNKGYERIGQRERSIGWKVCRCKWVN